MNEAYPFLKMIHLFGCAPGRLLARILFRSTTAITVISFFTVHFFNPTPASADRLDEIRQRGTLVWGADKDGGAPYISLDKDDTTKLVGFEVELAEMLAKELGVKAEFQHGEWENLPDLLKNRKIDIVINGYELDAERQASYRCSRPYYVYGLQLLVAHDSSIQFWKDLRSKVGPIRKVGVLGGSAADRFFQNKETDLDKWNQYVEVIKYTGSIECLNDVKAGRLDATLQDDCFAVQFADEYPTLRFVERPVASGYYVALMHRDDERLQVAINDAFSKIINDGRIKELYDRFNMGGRAQVVSLRNTSEVPPAKPKSLWTILHDNLGLLLEGAAMTVVLSLVAMPIAIVIGILVALGRLYGPAWLEFPLTVYVEVLRGTPLMLQLFFIYFLLPEVGISLPALAAAIIGLAVNYSAYEAEIYRAGLQAISIGQMEAALAIGLTKRQAILRIILPQAFRIVIPPVTNDFIALFKDTSVCSVVTVVELTKQYNILAHDNPSALVHLAAITAVLYMLMSYPLSLFARWSEQRLAGVK